MGKGWMCGRMLSKERKTKDLINEMIPLPRNFFFLNTQLFGDLKSEALSRISPSIHFQGKKLLNIFL